MWNSYPPIHEIKSTGKVNDAAGTDEKHVVGPEFCGGALSKGGNAIADKSDSTGGIVPSKFPEVFATKVDMISSLNIL